MRGLRQLVDEVLGEELRSRCVMWGGFEYDPVGMFSVLIYALMLGERSVRRIEDLCVYDTRFWYLSGGVKPHFTTIHRFRRGLDEARGLDTMFRKIVDHAKAQGLVKGRTAFIDGTKIPTSGSQWRKWLDEAEGQALEDGLAPDAAEPPAGEPSVDSQKPKAPKPKAKFKEPTDKEARTMKTTHGEYVRGFNCQLAVEPHSGIVIGAVPIDAPNDWSAVKALLETTEQHSGLKPKRLVADKGYESAANMQAAEHAQVKTYFCPKQRKAQPFKPDEHGVFRCLAGHAASHSQTTKRDVVYDVYKVSQCRLCTLRQACGKFSKGHQREMNVLGEEHIALSKANRKRSQSKAGKGLLRQRGQTVELPIARIKRDFRMRRFNLMGLQGATLELLLACIALNLQTMLRVAKSRLSTCFHLFNAILCIYEAFLCAPRPIRTVAA